MLTEAATELKPIFQAPAQPSPAQPTMLIPIAPLHDSFVCEIALPVIV